MAGASLDLRIDDAELQAELKRLADRIGDLKPFFDDVGEELLNSTRERFRSQTDPEGNPWAALNPVYRQRKKRNKDKILTLWGHLRGTLVKQTDRDSLRIGTLPVSRIGTPMDYAAAHQFGRPERNLPARPFLGLSAADREALLDALREYLSGE